MFCYQCQQTSKGTGCNDQGVCGKDPLTAGLQDLLNKQAIKVGALASKARKAGQETPRADVFVLEALFTTVTNVNFDPESIKDKLLEGCEIMSELPGGANEPLAKLRGISTTDLYEQAKEIAIAHRLSEHGEDVTGLQELALYGLKGAGAYYYHALMQGFADDQIMSDIHGYLEMLDSDPTDVGQLVGAGLGIGELNFRVMALLDKANTEVLGHPGPTPVRITPVKGKAILVSGHDLADLLELLKQTEGTGINVYTHGEMLPAHGYPGLKKYPHLVGNFGGAWQLQPKEFKQFPGAILMTTNCIQRPSHEYEDRLFTTGVVHWPGVKHVVGRDDSKVIAAALAADGFTEDEPEKSILVGFGHQTLLQNAGTVIDAVKAGALRHIFLIGGCDGAHYDRNYFTDLADHVPSDCVILTLGCGKYRFNKHEFGTLGGLPRLLDIGQCNDAYSAIVVASELAKAFDCSVNDLPLSLVISWFEQKAVAILLTLLHLGIKNIRLGPSLPAFITPTVLKVLVDNYNIMEVTTAKQDLEAILGASSI